MASEEYRVQWTGSRGWPTSRLLDEIVRFVDQHAFDNGQALVMAHGGAKGADSMAESEAVMRGIQTKVWLPDWGTHGRKAGILRNERMVDEFKPTIGIGLNWNNSPGTRHCVSYMKSKGIPVLSIEYTGDPEGKVFPF